MSFFANARNVDARHSQMNEYNYPNGVVHHDNRIIHQNNSTSSNSSDLYSTAPSPDSTVGGVCNPMYPHQINRSITHNNHSRDSHSGDIYNTGNNTSFHTAQSAPGPGSGNSPWGGSPPEGSAQSMRRSDTQYSNPTSLHDQTLMHGPLYDEPVPDYTPNPSYTTIPSMTSVDAKAYLERGHPSTQKIDYTYSASASGSSEKFCVAGGTGGRRPLPITPAHTNSFGEKLEQLKSMGCTDLTRAIKALDDAGGDINIAAMILFPSM